MLDYSDAISLITSKNNFYVDLGLDRISAVLNRLGNPQDDLKYIHVAGTNGKGSVCAMLSSVLSEAGYKTGLYTSPHIWDYTERIQINGIKIPKDRFASYVKSIFDCKIHLTEFEILTVIMFMYFKEERVDIVILETGLGGRLDATNVIKNNLCSIITHIDYDHTDILGDTKEKIAAEKSGIIKPNSVVITGMGYEVIKDSAEKLNSMIILVTPNVSLEYLEALALKGRHQVENLALVLETLQYLFPNISEKTLIAGLKNVKHPCRFEYIKEKNLIVDASHNPNGIQALRENLDYYYPNQRRRFVFGCLKTKDYKKMMEILFREDDEIFLKEFNYPKSCSYKELSLVCRYNTKKYCNDEILTKEKLNIICGSFYMLNEFKFLKR